MRWGIGRLTLGRFEKARLANGIGASAVHSRVSVRSYNIPLTQPSSVILVATLLHPLCMNHLCS